MRHCIKIQVFFSYGRRLEKINRDMGVDSIIVNEARR